jgi:SNF2 family DNA or RNA helicase
MTLINPFKLRSGGFLCDQTGLGKTRTIIEHIRRDWITARHGRPTLIMVQPNIVVQWKRECAKWAPDLPVVVFYGS